MAKSFLILGSAGGSFSYSTGSIYYSSFVCNFANSLTYGEESKEYPIRDAGTMSNLFTYVSTNSASTSFVITLRKSRADTSATVTYLTTETGVKEDTTHSVSFANTDEADYKIVASSGSGSFTPRTIGIQFESDTSSNSTTVLGVSAQNPITSNSASCYMCPNGGGAFSATSESDVEYRCRFSFTSSNLFVYIPANTRTTNTVFNTRVNSSDGSQSVTYGSGETGAKEDTSNTDSLSSGDDFCLLATTSTGGGSITISSISTQSLSTNNLFALLNGRGTASTAVGTSTTIYIHASGNHITTATTEAYTQALPRFDFTMKELECYVTANTSDNTTTMYIRDNGSSSSVSVAFSTGETGLKNDTTNSVSITGGTDYINYLITNVSTSGSTSFRWVGSLGETAAASTFTPKVMMM